MECLVPVEPRHKGIINEVDLAQKYQCDSLSRVVGLLLTSAPLMDRKRCLIAESFQNFISSSNGSCFVLDKAATDVEDNFDGKLTPGVRVEIRWWGVCVSA